MVNLKVNLLDFTNLKIHTERETWKASKLRSNDSGTLWLCNHSLKREKDRRNDIAYLRYDDHNFLRFGQEIYFPSSRRGKECKDFRKPVHRTSVFRCSWHLSPFATLSNCIAWDTAGVREHGLVLCVLTGYDQNTSAF